MQLLPSLLFGISASLDALLVGVSYGLRKIRIRTLQNLVISLVSLLGTCFSACLGRHLLPFLPPAFAGCIGSIILMILGAYYIIKWILSVSAIRLQAKNKARSTDMSIQVYEAEPDGIPLTSCEAESTGIPLTSCEAESTDIPLTSCEAESTGIPLTSCEAQTPDDLQTPTKDKALAADRRAGLSAWETILLSLTLSVNNIGIGLSASMAGLPLLPAAAMTFVCSALFLLCGNQLGQIRFLRLIGSAADPISGLLLIGLGILQLTI